jgi:hypothetical protein
MADLSLTKRSGRLKVNIGAVLRTRMNTGDYHLVQLPAESQEDTTGARGRLREMG